MPFHLMLPQNPQPNIRTPHFSPTRSSVCGPGPPLSLSLSLIQRVSNSDGSTSWRFSQSIEEAEEAKVRQKLSRSSAALHYLTLACYEIGSSDALRSAAAPKNGSLLALLVRFLLPSLYPLLTLYCVLDSLSLVWCDTDQIEVRKVEGETGRRFPGCVGNYGRE